MDNTTNSGEGSDLKVNTSDAAQPKHWKTVDCPTCDSKAGQSCGRPKFGVPWQWERTAPHAARKRAADMPRVPRCKGEG